MCDLSYTKILKYYAINVCLREMASPNFFHSIPLGQLSLYFYLRGKKKGYLQIKDGNKCMSF